MAVEPITFNTQLVTPDGKPTEFFLLAWQTIVEMKLSDLSDVNALAPTDGQVLTYSAAQKKWIAS